MPHIDTIEPTDASEEVRALYVDFQRRMGFPAAPNFIKTQGHSLAAASGAIIINLAYVIPQMSSAGALVEVVASTHWRRA